MLIYLYSGPTPFPFRYTHHRGVFDGLVDDVAIFGGALTVAEITGYRFRRLSGKEKVRTVPNMPPTGRIAILLDNPRVGPGRVLGLQRRFWSRCA
jgi:hypothetical protein